MEDIINNANVSSLKLIEISKVYCLPNTWKFLLSDINALVHLGYLQKLHELVARFDVDYRYLGKWSTKDVLINGTSGRPSLLDADKMYEGLQKLLELMELQTEELKLVCGS